LKKGTNRHAISTFLRYDYYLIVVRLVPYFGGVSTYADYQQVTTELIVAL